MLLNTFALSLITISGESKRGFFPFTWRLAYCVWNVSLQAWLCEFQYFEHVNLMQTHVYFCIEWITVGRRILREVYSCTKIKSITNRVFFFLLPHLVNSLKREIHKTVPKVICQKDLYRKNFGGGFFIRLSSLRVYFLANSFFFFFTIWFIITVKKQFIHSLHALYSIHSVYEFYFPPFRSNGLLHGRKLN